MSIGSPANAAARLTVVNLGGTSVTISGTAQLPTAPTKNTMWWEDQLVAVAIATGMTLPASANPTDLVRRVVKRSAPTRRSSAAAP